MTRVDFYLAASGIPRERLACRLAEIAYQRGHQVLILTTADALPALDTLLWSFAAASFVPHGRYGVDEAPVLLAIDDVTDGDVLIPLAPAPPRRLDGFARILEIVGGSDPEKQESRRRFRYYRDAGLTPAVHTLS